jgi:hypothetical protein
MALGKVLDAIDLFSSSKSKTLPENTDASSTYDEFLIMSRLLISLLSLSSIPEDSAREIVCLYPVLKGRPGERREELVLITRVVSFNTFGVSSNRPRDDSFLEGLVTET